MGLQPNRRRAKTHGTHDWTTLADCRSLDRGRVGHQAAQSLGEGPLLTADVDRRIAEICARLETMFETCRKGMALYDAPLHDADLPGPG